MKRSLLALAAVGLLACPPAGPAYPPPGGGGGGGTVSSGAKPGWVDGGQAAQYPQMQNMTGVGQGAGRAVCENSARATIAKTFSANISQVSRDWQGHFSKVNSAGANVRVEAMSVQQLTQVSTNYTLKGIEIKAVWKSPTGTFHCLGVLDRVSSAQTLRGEIQRLDAQIQAAVQEGDRSSDPTTRFMQYKKAIEMLQRREAMNADLRVVSRSGMAPTWGWARLVAKFNRSKSRIKIGFHIKGRERAKVQSCLGEALTKRGITVTEGTSDVNLWIHGKIDMKKAGYNNGAEMVRATLNMRITGTRRGKTIAAFTRDVKVGRRSLPQSIQLAASKICFDVAPKLAQEIEKALSR